MHTDAYAWLHVFKFMTNEIPVLPKIIWSLWLQGWDEASEIVRSCITSWKRLNPEWDIRLLTREHVHRLLFPTSPFARLVDLDLPPEALSDVVRLELLARFGGVWADATTYCLIPLDGWLGPAVTQGFFAFDRPGPDRMLASWFLAAPPASPVVLIWRDLAEKYWAERSQRDTYFWVHDLFARAYETDPSTRRIWDATPKRSADGPHVFAPYQSTLYAPLAEPARQIVDTGTTPMLKLTHKLNAVASDRGTLYRWLCDRERSDSFGAPVESWTGTFE